MSTNHFIFDKNKCVGCEACVVACVTENGFQSPDQWRSITSSNQLKVAGLPLFHLSMACNHCEDAPCMKYCPAMAFKRSNKTGAVLHIENHCIGCKYCTWQCPYDAPKFNPVKGTVEKCTFCESRLLEGQKPACTSLCPTGALNYSSDPINKGIVQDDLKVSKYPKPSIKIKDLQKQEGPKMDLSLFEGEEFEPLEIQSEVRSNALKEWPLLVFTLIVALLTALQLFKSAFMDHRFANEIFIGIGFIGAVLSTLHLGRKERMWRSILNLRYSWLSREILFFGLFMAVSLVHFYLFDIQHWILVCLGTLLCLSVDMLYQPAQWKWKAKIHSAQITLIALSITLFLSEQALFFVILMGIRLLLFVYRKVGVIADKKKWLLIVFRIASVFATFGLLFQDQSLWLLVVSFALGEILDRIDFYNELNVPKPRVLIKAY